MNAQTDWSHWGTTWRERTDADPERLYRRVRRKRRTTLVAVALKVVLTLIMVRVLGYQLLEPATGLIWKIWFAAVIVLVLSSTALTVHTLRDTWHVAPQGVPDVLRFTIRRAHAGIRLSSIGTLLFALLVAITVCMHAWWHLLPAGARGPQPDMLAPIPLAVGGVVAVLVALLKFIAVARLHRTLRDAETWLREYTS